MTVKNAAGSTQTAVARRAAEAQLSALADRFAPAHLQLIATTREHLRKLLPTAHEVVYEYRDCFVISFSPTGQGSEGVFAIRASVDAVALYFNQGKGLPDPAKLLKGSGKQARSINLEDEATLVRPEVARLIDEAIARNQVPYESTGRGSVVIRPTSAQQRRHESEAKDPS